MPRNYRKYKQFIFVCKGKDCKKSGAKDILKAFEKCLKKLKLSKTTKLLEGKCMGCCKEAPVAIKDNQLYCKLSSERVEELFFT